jgi:Swt1-like HEPN
VPFAESMKLFGMTTQLIEHDLDRVEGEFAVDLRRDHQSLISADEAYYPQIESEIRAEAASMAPHYEVFYSLETSIRRLVAESLEAEHGDDWWETTVPEQIRKDAQKAKKNELEAGTTPRSDALLDYTTFGQLTDIIVSNWGVFGGMLSNQKAVSKVLASLNTLRGPVAHCSPLADDEVVRLKLAVRDWFRLME